MGGNSGHSATVRFAVGKPSSSSTGEASGMMAGTAGHTAGTGQLLHSSIACSACASRHACLCRIMCAETADIAGVELSPPAVSAHPVAFQHHHQTRGAGRSLTRSRFCRHSGHPRHAVWRPAEQPVRRLPQHSACTRLLPGGPKAGHSWRNTVPTCSSLCRYLISRVWMGQGLDCLPAYAKHAPHSGEG